MIPVERDLLDESLKVRIVNWDSLPKSVHIGILQSLDIGEYMNSLPYKFPDGYRTVKIPLPVKAEASIASNKITYTETPYLEFERVTAVIEHADGNEHTHVYRRIK